MARGEPGIERGRGGPGLQDGVTGVTSINGLTGALTLRSPMLSTSGSVLRIDHGNVKALTSAASVTGIDVDLNTSFTLTVAENLTIANPTASIITTPRDGEYIRFLINQSSEGGGTLAWGTKYAFAPATNAYGIQLAAFTNAYGLVNTSGLASYVEIGFRYSAADDLWYAEHMTVVGAADAGGTFFVDETNRRVGIGQGASAPATLVLIRDTGSVGSLTYTGGATPQLVITAFDASNSVFLDLSNTSANVRYEVTTVGAGNKGRIGTTNAAGFDLMTNNVSRVRLDSSANLELTGIGGLATTATDAFPYIPSMAGRPTGTPTDKTNMRPVVWDRTNKRIYLNEGGSTDWNRFDGRSLFSQIVSLGNIGAGETDVFTYTLPANTLLNDLESMDVDFTVEYAANANAKRIRILFDGSTIMDTGSVAQNSGSMVIRLRIWRITNTGQRSYAYWIFDAATETLPPTGVVHGAPTVTLSSNVDLVVKATGVANNDLVLRMAFGQWKPRGA